MTLAQVVKHAEIKEQLEQPSLFAFWPEILEEFLTPSTLLRAMLSSVVGQDHLVLLLWAHSKDWVLPVKLDWNILLTLLVWIRE